MSRLKFFLFCAVQFTWGLPQNLVGGIAWLLLRKKHKQERFHYSFVTYVSAERLEGTTLGMFIFINPEHPDSWVHDIRIHEYGHTIQSLVLGPLDILLAGLPSAVWFSLPALKRYREKNQVSYFRFYPESWANRWGQRWADDRLIDVRLLEPELKETSM